MIDNKKVGKTISTLRQSRGMTQQQLAAALNVSHQAVSRWENGSALPDIQTMIELTRLFGITVEQLLSGEAPAEPDKKEAPQDTPLQSIGNFVNGVIQDIGNIFKSDADRREGEDAQDDGAEDAEVSPEDIEGAEAMDVQKLLQMAPFLSKEALQEMLDKVKTQLTAQEIARFAPFVTSEYLESLIARNHAEITWDTLRRIAPFLQKEAVDGFARILARGGKCIGVTQDEKKAADDVRRAMQNAGTAVANGADTVARNVVQFGSGIIDKVGEALRDLSEPELSAEERIAKIRLAAFEKALKEDRWDWIADHIAEAKDPSLRRRIAERAGEMGKQDWVFEHMGGYATADMIKAAVAENNWGWLGDHAWEFDPEMQQMVALSAMRAENWKWLSDFSEQLSLDECVLEIASNARRSGARMLAVQLARYDMKVTQLESLAIESVEAEDETFFDMILDILPPEVFCRCCIRMTKTKGWQGSQKYLEKLDERGIEWMMNLAIDEGNFEAFDQLDAILKIRSRRERDEEDTAEE